VALNPSVTSRGALDDRDLVALVEATGEGRTCLGTGYLVAPGVVLTAAHVVDEAQPTNLRAVFAADDEEEDTVRILWTGSHKSLDAALLGLSTKRKPRGTSAIRKHLPSPTQPWDSKGFALRSSSFPGGHTDPSRYGGTVVETGDGSWIELRADSPPETWAGLSGAPLFVEGALTGVVITQPGGYRKKDRIRALSLGAFIDNVGFCQHVDLDPLRRSSQELRKGLEEKLRSSPPVRKRLEEILEATDILAGICSRSSHDVMHLFFRVWEDPRGAKKQDVLDALRWAIPLGREWDEGALILLQGMGSPATSAHVPLRVEDPAGIAAIEARALGEPMDLEHVRSLGSVSFRGRGGWKRGVDLDLENQEASIIRRFAKLLAVPDQPDLDSLYHHIEKVLTVRRTERLFVAPWMLLEDYRGRNEDIEELAERFAKKVPSLVVVLAKGSNAGSKPHVDVFIGDTVRNMLREEEEAKDPS